MDTFTVRVDDSTKQELDSEYGDYGFDDRSDYIRHLLEHRDVIMDGAPSEATMGNRLDDLEAELSDVKAAMRVFHPVGAPERGNHDIELGEGVEHSAFGPGPGEPTPREREAAESAPAPRVESVDDLDIRGQGEVVEARRAALQAVYERLQQLGEASKRELLEVVEPDAVGYKDVDSFWSNVIGGRDTLSQLPGVEPPVAGGRTWRYVGEG